MVATSAVPRSPRTRSRRRQRTPTRHTSAAPDESEILTPAHHVHQDQHAEQHEDQHGDQQGDQQGEQTLLVTPPALLPPEPEPEPALADQVQNLQEQVQRLQERLQTRDRPSTGGKKPKEPPVLHFTKCSDPMQVSTWCARLEDYWHQWSLNGRQCSENDKCTDALSFMAPVLYNLARGLQFRNWNSLKTWLSKELNPAQGMYSRVGSVLEHNQGKQPLAQYYAQHSARVQAIPDCGCPPHFRCCARQFIEGLSLVTLIKGLEPSMKRALETWDRLPHADIFDQETKHAVHTRIFQVARATEHKQKSWFSYRQPGQRTAPVTAVTDEPGPQLEPQPLTVNSITAGHLSKLPEADRKRYIAQGLCFKCGKPGHKSRNCKAVIAALLEAAAHMEAPPEPHMEEIASLSPEEPSLLDEDPSEDLFSDGIFAVQERS